MARGLIEEGIVLKEETVEFDLQWGRIIELELAPHPEHPGPELACMDYGITDGVLKVRVRAATAGYMLRRWSVDCSPHRLRGLEYALGLGVRCGRAVRRVGRASARAPACAGPRQRVCMKRV